MLTSADGFKLGMSVSVSPVMLGSNLPAVEEAWSSLGGPGELPCSSGGVENDNPNFTIQPELMGYAVGRITLTNESPGFTPPNQNFILHGLGGMGAASLGLSNGTQCMSLSQGYNFVPNWTGNTWQVPMLIAVYNYRSPAHPNGDPSKLSDGMHFDLGSLKFPLEPTAN